MKKPIFELGELVVFLELGLQRVPFEIDTIAVNSAGEIVYSGPTLYGDVNNRILGAPEKKVSIYVPQKKFWLWATESGDTLSVFMDDNFICPKGFNQSGNLKLIKLHWSEMEFSYVPPKPTDVKFDPEYKDDGLPAFPKETGHAYIKGFDIGRLETPPTLPEPLTQKFVNRFLNPTELS